MSTEDTRGSSVVMLTVLFAAGVTTAYAIAPGDASHKLRKGFLFIWGHQDFWLLRDCALDRRTLGMMAGPHPQVFNGTRGLRHSGTLRRFNRGHLQASLDA